MSERNDATCAARVNALDYLSIALSCSEGHPGCALTPKGDCSMPGQAVLEQMAQDEPDAMDALEADALAWVKRGTIR